MSRYFHFPPSSKVKKGQTNVWQSCFVFFSYFFSHSLTNIGQASCKLQVLLCHHFYWRLLKANFTEVFGQKRFCSIMVQVALQSAHPKQFLRLRRFWAPSSTVSQTARLFTTFLKPQNTKLFFSCRHIIFNLTRLSVVLSRPSVAYSRVYDVFWYIFATFDSSFFLKTFASYIQLLYAFTGKMKSSSFVVDLGDLKIYQTHPSISCIDILDSVRRCERVWGRAFYKTEEKILWSLSGRAGIEAFGLTARESFVYLHFANHKNVPVFRFIKKRSEEDSLVC